MALVSRWSLGTSTPDNEGLQSTNPVGWGSRRDSVPAGSGTSGAAQGRGGWKGRMERLNM